MRSGAYLRGAGVVTLAVLGGCRDRPSDRPAVVVRAPAPVAVDGASPVTAPTPALTEPQAEIQIIEPENTLPAARAVELARSPVSPAAEAAPSSAVADESVRDSVPVAAETVDAPVAVTIPAGTRLELELRTPLHSATTRVGDRFAARTLHAVFVDDRVAVPANALVEGRIARVASADDAEQDGAPIDGEGRAFVALDFRWLVLPNGDRLPLVAAMVAPEGQVIPSRPSAVAETAARVGGSVGGAILGDVIAGRGGSIVGAILGGIAGGAIVSKSGDREVLVPTGTRLSVELEAPIIAAR